LGVLHPCWSNRRLGRVSAEGQSSGKSGLFPCRKPNREFATEWLAGSPDPKPETGLALQPAVMSALFWVGFSQRREFLIIWKSARAAPEIDVFGDRARSSNLSVFPKIFNKNKEKWLAVTQGFEPWIGFHL
jgi:hypothetical protein